MKKDLRKLIDKIDFGSIDAENDNLSDYFYSTPAFERILNGKIDLILGHKGAGKSAIFKTMVDLQGFHKGIEEKYILPINNPNSFINIDKAGDHIAFDQISLWKLWKIYFCILIGKYLIELSTLSADVSFLKKQFSKSGFSDEVLHRKPINQWISEILKSPYISVKIDGIEYKMGLSLPPQEKDKKIIFNINEILEIENQMLGKGSKELWILIDKLDEMLPGAKGTEEKRNIALQALMNVQSELSIYKYIKVKIFLRSDIYDSLTFVNKDHFMDKKVEISWDIDHLEILLAIRIAACLGEYNPMSSGQFAISQKKAHEFFNTVFDHISLEGNSVRAIEWMFNQLKDGKGFVSPRDVIFLAKESTNVQKDYFSREINEPRTALISQDAMIEAFNSVSKAKLNDYLYGVFPHVKRSFESFRGVNKRKMKFKEISKYLGDKDKSTVLLRLEELCELGALEKIGNRSIEQTDEFVIPIIYSKALDIAN